MLWFSTAPSLFSISHSRHVNVHRLLDPLHLDADRSCLPLEPLQRLRHARARGETLDFGLQLFLKGLPLLLQQGPTLSSAGHSFRFRDPCAICCCSILLTARHEAVLPPDVPLKEDHQTRPLWLANATDMWPQAPPQGSGTPPPPSSPRRATRLGALFLSLPSPNREQWWEDLSQNGYGKLSLSLSLSLCRMVFKLLHTMQRSSTAAITAQSSSVKCSSHSGLPIWWCDVASCSPLLSIHHLCVWTLLPPHPALW